MATRNSHKKESPSQPPPHQRVSCLLVTGIFYHIHAQLKTVQYSMVLRGTSIASMYSTISAIPNCVQIVFYGTLLYPLPNNSRYTIKFDFSCSADKSTTEFISIQGYIQVDFVESFRLYERLLILSLMSLLLLDSVAVILFPLFFFLSLPLLRSHHFRRIRPRHTSAPRVVPHYRQLIKSENFLHVCIQGSCTARLMRFMGDLASVVISLLLLLPKLLRSLWSPWYYITYFYLENSIG